MARETLQHSDGTQGELHGERAALDIQSGQSEQAKQDRPTKPASRPHVYELDPMRAVTALSVVGVHVLAFSFFLEHTSTATLMHGAVLNALHFTRQVFMFFTAFALIYVYYGKPFSVKRFWIKRSIGVVLPYSIWSIIYTWVNTPKPFWPFVGTSLFNILTGSASYQLYYILLSIQFYIILPFFMAFLKRIAHHPWIALSISFVVQVVFLYLDFHYLQGGPLGSTPIGRIIVGYQDSFLLTYQFFFFLGAFAALYLQQSRNFLLRHGRLVVSFFLIITVAFWGHYFLQNLVFHESNGFTLSVLQPAITFYSLGVILLFSWVASLWARRTDAKGRPRGSLFWHYISDASFGLYLIHALILNHVVMPYVVPMLHITAWPSALSLIVIWILTAGSSLLISFILLRIPYASRLVGRAHPKEQVITSHLLPGNASGRA